VRWIFSRLSRSVRDTACSTAFASAAIPVRLQTGAGRACSPPEPVLAPDEIIGTTGKSCQLRIGPWFRPAHVRGAQDWKLEASEQRSEIAGRWFIDLLTD
jgi:hypothetical protein